MLVSEAFPSKYLAAADIPEDNLRVIMGHVEPIEMKENNQTKKKLCLFFQGMDKGIVLNKTNATNIAAAYGDDTDGWMGRELILFTTWVDFQGKSVEAIRVRAPQPKDQRRAPPPQVSAPFSAEFR